MITSPSELINFVIIKTCDSHMFGSVGRKECFIVGKKIGKGKKIPLSVPFNEEKYVIIACKDLVIMTPNYIGRRSVFNSI